MDPVEEFKKDRKNSINLQTNNSTLRKITNQWIIKSSENKYTYNFDWLGRPVIQFPQDLIAVQELIWRIKPDLIIETGIAHGGSLIFSASILELLGKGDVIGIDIEIRPHNKKAIENHFLSKRITMIEGSSIEKKVIDKIYELAKNKSKILIMLDSNHTHMHVLKELNAYAPLVKKGSYIIVYDTIIEYMPDRFYQDRPWSKGNNPKTATDEFLIGNNKFEVDDEIENKILITMAPGGYLKCIKD